MVMHHIDTNTWGQPFKKPEDLTGIRSSKRGTTGWYSQGEKFMIPKKEKVKAESN